MDITLYISRFLYRIRHQLIFGTLIVTALYNPQNHPSTFSKRSVSILRFFSKTKRLF